MNSLENRLKEMAIKAGAGVVGIGTRERLDGAPPSGDPGYLLPSARSIVSFAIPFDKQNLRNYFGKRRWRVFGDEQKSIMKKLYIIEDLLVKALSEEGYEARGVNINCVYRPENGAADFVEMTRFVPDFSHQYGAVAAGLGRLGLSGNLLTPEYGAAVLLGTVLTSATLHPDPLCKENPCDQCGFCIQVCPVEMMDKKERIEDRIAGVTERIADRRPHTCCWIGCGDYHGLSADGSWSNWSPYRIDTPLPSRKEDLEALLIRLRQYDPESFAEPNPYTDHRAVTFDPDWSFSATCGNCANICWKDREDREENARLVSETGIVVLRIDGTREATHEDIVELETPYGSRVAVTVSDHRKMPDFTGGAHPFRGHLPKDREVLTHLLNTINEENN